MTNEKKYLYLAGGVVALLLIVRAKKLFTEDLNPADENNVVNRVVNGGYQYVTGSSGTLGTDLYNVLHKDTGENVLNPASDANPLYQGANAVYRIKTGSAGTIGTDIYDALHDEKGRNILNPFNWFD